MKYWLIKSDNHNNIAIYFKFLMSIKVLISKNKKKSKDFSGVICPSTESKFNGNAVGNLAKFSN